MRDPSSGSAPRRHARRRSPRATRAGRSPRAAAIRGTRSPKRRVAAPSATSGQVVAVAHVHLQPRAGPNCAGSAGCARARGGQQAVEVGEGFVELRQQFAVVLRRVADDAGRARQQQRHRAARRRQHRAREARRLRAVLARVAVGADLARILDRRAGRARGQPVDLQRARVVAAADRGRRRQRARVEVAQAARAADAELAVAFVVAVAQGDRVEVVPDAQQVRVPLPRTKRSGARRRVAASRDAARCRRRRPRRSRSRRTAARRRWPRRSSPSRPRATGALARQTSNGAGAMRLQRHAQVARIVVVRRIVAEAEHRQRVVAGQQRRGRRGVDVVHRQARRRNVARHRRHRPAHGLPGCSVSPPKPLDADLAAPAQPAAQRRGAMLQRGERVDQRGTGAAGAAPARLSNTSPASIEITACSTCQIVARIGEQALHHRRGEAVDEPLEMLRGRA